MSATPCPTCPTVHQQVGQRKILVFRASPDPPDLPDRKAQGGDENATALSALAARWRSEMDHDAAEAEAMAEHYAAPADPELPTPDPLTAGLLAGFRRHAAVRSHSSQKGTSHDG